MRHSIVCRLVIANRRIEVVKYSTYDSSCGVECSQVSKIGSFRVMDYIKSYFSIGGSRRRRVACSLSVISSMLSQTPLK